MENVIEFFNYILELIRNFGDNSDNFWERIIVWLGVAYFEIKIQTIQISYSIAQSILSTINISEIINQYWGGMNSQILGAITYLRIPESINIILSAMVTRFVMDLSPL